MVNAQEWLDKEYPKDQRKNTINLNIKEKELEGSLDLSDFINLKKLNCNQNKITKLDASKCDKLWELYCDDNRWIEELILPTKKEKLKTLVISSSGGMINFVLIMGVIYLRKI